MSRFIGTLAAAILALSTSVQAETIKVSTGEYAPFTGEALPNGGVVNGLIARVAEAAGVTVEYEYMPWKRALEVARAGQVQASSYWGVRPDQTGLTMVGPFALDRNVLFYRKDKPIPEFQAITDLTEVQIGVTHGYSYTPEFWTNVENGTLKTQTAKDDASNFRKLLAGRIDAFIIDDYVGHYLLEQEFTAEERAQLAASENALMGSGGFLQVSLEAEGGAELANRLQAAFDAMTASGEMDTIRAELNAAAGLGG
ncbi:substrate-binding periplasmic protein [Arenibacterium sp. LLYu02]|uniref:substrate-binding periplasmic protein n=1 Tax=Arenibacterium sp. LLYu02 TaxID=3404132 RepID=UPI003B21FC28